MQKKKDNWLVASITDSITQISGCIAHDFDERYSLQPGRL